MSRALVVSQPMFLPWLGLFEQVRLADVFIHYDDVQRPQGRSFMSRVQIKSAAGVCWLTVPIDHTRSGKRINEVMLLQSGEWRERHLRTLRHAYARRPHFKEMYELADEVYAQPTDQLAEFNIQAIERIAGRLDLAPTFLRSSHMGVAGASTQRLVDLCQAVGCDSYITGHGALNYLNYQQFEDKGISVRYMDYRKVPYEQAHGEFTPHVTIFDAIANCGPRTRDLLCSEATYWREFNAT